VYLGDVSVSLARVCAHVAEAASGEALHARAAEVARLLRTSLSVHFKESELHSKAEECRAILAQAYPETEAGHEKEVAGPGTGNVATR
jgi:hypothetical protein